MNDSGWICQDKTKVIDQQYNDYEYEIVYQFTLIDWQELGIIYIDIFWTWYWAKSHLKNRVTQERHQK